VTAPTRVRVVGTSGAGKSTLARAIADRLGLPHLELDSIFHLAGWQQATDQQFGAALEAFQAGPGRDGWVIDGNYQSRTAHLRPDVVVWLDHPRRVVMARVVRRTLTRGVRRVELWNGNRERLRSWLRLDPEENIVLWAWVNFDRYRAGYAARMAEPGDAAWVRLRSPRQAARWLDRLGR
jgi:cytidylate kinase